VGGRGSARRNLLRLIYGSAGPIDVGWAGASSRPSAIVEAILSLLRTASRSFAEEGMAKNKLMQATRLLQPQLFVAICHIKMKFSVEMPSKLANVCCPPCILLARHTDIDRLAECECSVQSLQLDVFYLLQGQ